MVDLPNNSHEDEHMNSLNDDVRKKLLLDENYLDELLMGKNDWQRFRLALALIKGGLAPMVFRNMKKFPSEHHGEISQEIIEAGYGSFVDLPPGSRKIKESLDIDKYRTYLQEIVRAHSEVNMEKRRLERS